jgi:hypothetical protein
MVVEILMFVASIVNVGADMVVNEPGWMGRTCSTFLFWGSAKPNTYRGINSMFPGS